MEGVVQEIQALVVQQPQQPAYLLGLEQIIRQDPTTRNIYGLVYDIHTPDDGNRNYNPAVLLPVDHPDKHIQSRDTFYKRLRSVLYARGFNDSEYSMMTKECTEAEVIQDAYALHTNDTLTWMPYCIRKMHVVKLVLDRSIYPLEYVNNNNVGENVQ
ncbi:hypothetical protein DLAC_01985 [Tieghemostelium lacteum]|uniref:Uncharacterized protein n=1 Tax=Tieghemostelium lacteum TaxID=361077 RepID=A0A152A580_TIELA|nr:hypothetical protein DLAC_01985 [Tieghemostelium lacteum]|eukprot:KYR01396.1 hypothetical protein DLAC_01985 [Tieghemostelium lacteum]